MKDLTATFGSRRPSRAMPQMRLVQMQIAGVDEVSDRTDAQMRIYKCSTCQHEMRLTVWAQ